MFFLQVLVKNCRFWSPVTLSLRRTVTLRPVIFYGKSSHLLIYAVGFHQAVTALRLNIKYPYITIASLYSLSSNLRSQGPCCGRCLILHRHVEERKAYKMRLTVRLKRSTIWRYIILKMVKIGNKK